MQNLFIANLTQFPEHKLLGIAKRQNNHKRSFLLVNKLQAKHIPVTPSVTLDYFRQLGQLAAKTCKKNERIMVIGFAETATAVGAAVAKEIENSVYCHTTRESIYGMEPLVQFLEEHSHAMNQDFFISEKFKLDQFDRIILVDDEITTGKTVANFIKPLKARGLVRPEVQFTIAALIISGQAEAILQDENSAVCCLTRIDTSAVSACEGAAKPGMTDYPEVLAAETIDLQCRVNPRIGTDFASYQHTCEVFARHIADKLNIQGGNTLVLGTEEFMYPALLLGKELEKTAAFVYCHATTRSPITASEAENYPIQVQCQLPSLYDSKRVSYLYNLQRYDAVVIVTDAPANSLAEQKLCGALKHFGNDRIYIARWIS